MNSIRFGTGGNSNSFYEEGFKTSLDVCSYLFNRGLDAYEYECTRGVKITPNFANALAVQSRRFDIALSLHAPYYINLASLDDSICQKSIVHLRKSLQAANWMNATRVVFHPGGVAKMDRGLALARAKDLLAHVVEEAKREGLLEHVLLCPETMGKRNEMGTLSEVLELCSIDSSVRPAVDFAHIHALYGGCLNNTTDYEQILNKIADRLGEEAIQNLHVHFSPIEFTKAGEKKHRTLNEKEFGPDFYPFAQVVAKHKLTPVVICESAGTQAEDAAAFQAMHWSCVKDNK